MAIHRNIICVMLSCAVTLLGATAASAHAELKQAEPAVDGTVATAPTSRFISASGSNLRLAQS